MTDNEIIEALKRCPQHTECCYCNSLEECGNKRNLTTSVFDLINRLQDEKQALINGQETLQNTIVEQKAEIERLKHRKTELQIRNQELQHEKSEAIKEFAERLTDKADLIKVNPFDSKWAISQDNIDNLVKEMTEVLKNGKR